VTACKAVSLIMKLQGFGRVVNDSSMFAVITIADRILDAASKSAASNMTRALAIGWAHIRSRPMRFYLDLLVQR